MKFSAQIIFESIDEDAAESRWNELRMFLAGSPVKGRLGNPIPVKEDDVVRVYTDGGCDRKAGGAGAWAFVIETPGEPTYEACGSAMDSTNNKMELTAVIKALEAVPFGSKVVVTSDSEYVIKGITQWVKGWVSNGWKNAKGEPVANQDLWKPLLQLYQMHDVSFEWVKGHAGHPQNERCDQLCTAAIKGLVMQYLANSDEVGA